jgi:hypothetical protein
MKKKVTKRKYTMEWFQQMQEENRRKLDEIMATPDYQEVLGKKYYGDNWTATLYGTHPARTQRGKESSERGVRRKNGEDVPYVRRSLHLPIIQMDLDGNELAQFPSAAEWAEMQGKKRASGQTIVNACKGRAFTAFGYKWKFKEDINDESQ